MIVTNQVQICYKGKCYRVCLFGLKRLIWHLQSDARSKATFIWRKPVPGRVVILQAKSNFASVYIRKKVNLFPRASNARTCSDCLALTKFTRLGVSRSLYGEVFSARRVTVPS